MSSKRGVVAPLKFSAGGSKHSTKKSSAMTITTPPPPTPPPPQSQASHPNLSPPPTVKSNALTVLSTGLTLKRSPLHLENWIACLLTLDGRDKFTKVLQYSCRLLSWYFGGLASSLPSPSAAATTAAATGAGGGILTHLFQDTHHRSILYQTLSHRFHLLYQSLVESRKAFRLGRSFIEYDKLRSMGWGEYLLGVMRGSPLLSEGMGGQRRHGRDLELKRRRRQFHAQSIPEHHDEDASSSTSSDRVLGGEDHGQESWNEDDEEEEKKAESASEAQPVKVIARPGRPHLPSRVSSNIGWGPSTASAKCKDDSSQATPQRTTTAASRTSPPKRTVSELGNMYRSTRSSSMGWIQSTKTNNASKASDVVPPAWKLIGTTFKLIGLMGFWTFDNLAFLTGSGFLDPLGGNGAGTTTTTKTTTTTSGSSVDAKSLRIQRKKRASEWGARFYFMGALAGLYVNVRGIAELWNGALRKARGDVARAVVSSTTNTTKAKEATASSSEDAILRAKQQLKAAETKLFELYLALLKSICDCIVFSNNPGVDLHLKLRGRKNHEGLHCCCGLISAGTVLFGNFPNA